jgi:membrane dipeptidase
VTATRSLPALGRFDFGLTADEEARAERLHDESVVVDLIYWGPVTYRSFPDDITGAVAKQVAGMSPNQVYALMLSLVLGHSGPDGVLRFKEAWDESGVTAGCRPIALGAEYNLAATLGFHQSMFDNQPWLRKALRADDIRQAKADGGHAGFINTQNVGALNPDLLEAVFHLGMRMVMLTYNNMNHLGAGCTERTDAGVSNQGAAIINRANQLGMMLDTAHCGRQTTLDCCSLSEAPVLASHTSADALFPHDRAKSDEELLAIAATGGVVGVVAVPFFLGAGTGVSIEAMLDHVDYMTRLIGWEHVAIGTDWPMPMTKAAVSRFFSTEGLAETGFRPEHNIQPEVNLVGFDDYRDFRNLTRGLVARKYSDEQVRGILGENFLRVFQAVSG